jgi:hypothetical protein
MSNFRAFPLAVGVQACRVGLHVLEPGPKGIAAVPYHGGHCVTRKPLKI